MRLFLLILLLSLLTACPTQPVWDVQFDYKPPPDSQSACVEGCNKTAKLTGLQCTTCNQGEYNRQTREFYQNKMKCTNQTCRDLLELIRPREGTHYDICKDVCDDDKAKFNACYVGCGGEVKESKVCVSNCGNVQ